MSNDNVTWINAGKKSTGPTEPPEDQGSEKTEDQGGYFTAVPFGPNVPPKDRVQRVLDRVGEAQAVCELVCERLRGLTGDEKGIDLVAGPIHDAVMALQAHQRALAEIWELLEHVPR